ncbi:SigE family RNA polymerase sigma factor [Kribbella sp. NPDC051587]|uniref:SigE family RNA polymerase sigma factor n=1 Tax=Kribbella sp. NPDC051587 TaxID=3364119 RepID=UPI0037ABD42E
MSSTEVDFEAFARANTHQLYRTAWLLTADSHQADDLVQETLGKLFRVWGRVRRVEKPAAYAQTVLTRTFISQRRRRSWHEQPTDVVPDRSVDGEDHELRLLLVQALAGLPALDRAVLVLRFFEDRSVEQVAADLGKSAGAIKNRTARALVRVRAVLGDDTFIAR